MSCYNPHTKSLAAIREPEATARAGTRPSGPNATITPAGCQASAGIMFQLRATSLRSLSYSGRAGHLLPPRSSTSFWPTLSLPHGTSARHYIPNLIRNRVMAHLPQVVQSDIIYFDRSALDCTLLSPPRQVPASAEVHRMNNQTTAPQRNTTTFDTISPWVNTLENTKMR